MPQWKKKKESYDEAVEQISEYQTKIDNNDYYVAVSYTHLDVYKRQAVIGGTYSGVCENQGDYYLYYVTLPEAGKLTIAMTAQMEKCEVSVYSCLLYTSRCV